MKTINITADELEAIENDVKKPSSVLDSVEVPKGLSTRQIQIAKHYTIEKMKQGFTINAFCKEFSVSTKSWYEWINEPSFNEYLTALSNAVIPDDEAEAYQQMKKHILRIAYKQNPTPKEIELFMSVFSYHAEADKRYQMEKLGLNKEQSGKVDNRTIEERRNVLLSRLRS